jgi:hypothetical protein
MINVWNTFLVLILLTATGCGKEAKFDAGSDQAQPPVTEEAPVDETKNQDPELDDQKNENEFDQNFSLKQECEDKDGNYKDGECICEEGSEYDDYRDKCVETNDSPDFDTGGNTNSTPSGPKVSADDIMKMVVPLSDFLKSIPTDGGPGGGPGGPGCGC